MTKLVSSARPVCLAAASSILSLMPVVSRADVPTFELHPVTVTGSGTPRTLGSEIAATSVLTRGDIERSGARDVVSVLNLLGTALVEQQGGSGAVAAVRIRGAYARDTLVLIDGVPLTDVTSGQASLSQIPADLIDRIEVVRGNLSALYGANATGGVIQIFTRRGVDGAWDAQVQAGVGSRATRSLSASVAGGSEALRARLNVGAERTRGFSAANPAIAPTANPDADGNSRHHAALAVDSQIAPGHRIGLDLRRGDGTVDYDSTSSFSAPTDTHSQHLVQKGATLRGQHALHPDWALVWRWAQADEERTDNSQTAFGPSMFSNVLHNRIVGADLNGSLGTGWTAQLGVESLRQSTDAATYTRQSRDTHTVRLGSNYDASWGGVQANIRHDKTSDFGSATSGLLGGKLNLPAGFSGIAMLSTSFTPPSLDFLFYDCTPFGFVCSNPSLTPEKARNLEAGIQWESAGTLVRATAFAVRYRDKIANALIDPSDPSSGFLPKNVNRASNNGVEVALRTTVGAWSLAGEATLQNPVDDGTGQRLVRRSREQFALRADYQAVRWHAGAALRHVGNRIDSGMQTLPSYTIVDASAHWVLTPEWTLQASMENLFDRQYQPTAGYNGRPRALFVGVAWQAKH
jgi:vitamin B12 transporter